MIKREYQKPTTKVVKIQHQIHILSGSDPRTLRGRRSTEGEDDTWYDLE